MLRSQDYHSHISKVNKTPSILTDVPRYPNAHLAFSKKVVYEEDNKGFHHNPQTGSERVEVNYEQQTTVPDGGVEIVYEQNVDVETHHLQYYPKKKFELQKWKTFRP